MSSAPPLIFDATDPTLARLVDHLRQFPKRIVFPDGNDPRVLRVAAELVRLEAVAPILLGNRAEIQATARGTGIPLEFIGIIEPETSHDFELFCARYRKMERYRRMKVDDPGEVMRKPAYYAAMMLQYGYADGLVAGNIMVPSAVFRALFHMIKKIPGLDSVGSCMPVRLPNMTHLGTHGTLFLADCAVIPSPTVPQLAMLAVETARVAGAILNETPRVAMISFSTRGSAQNASTQRMLAATSLAREQARHQLVPMEIDGEMEVDAAIHPPAASRKAPNSLIAGRANVLIFPDLNAAHSAYQLLEWAAGAHTGGQLVLGLARPAAQVSRVASESTIFRAAIATATRAIAYRHVIENE